MNTNINQKLEELGPNYESLEIISLEEIQLIEDENKENEIEKHKIFREFSNNDCSASEILNQDSERSPDKEEELKKKKKAETIKEVLNSHPCDLEKLRELAIAEGGLIADNLRKQAWPQLMHIEKLKFSSVPAYEEIQKHKDYNQVLMDVNRSLKRFPPGIDEDYRYILMNQLTILIIRVLDKHPHLHYYQGYHDVAITFLLVTGEIVGFQLVEKLSLTHLADFMRPTMERTTYYLTYLYPVLKRVNSKLYEHLTKSGVGTVFCLPWLITWYAHTISDYRNVVRLYDFFLATPYLMPMYIAVAIVLHRDKAILAEECDMAMQHFVLSQVPDSLPFEELLKKAMELYRLYPPDEMQEEVEEMICIKKLEEEEERKQIAEKRWKRNNPSKPSPFRGMVSALIAGDYFTPWQRRLLRILAVAMVATMATGLYGYYTESPYLTPYYSYFISQS